MAPPSRSLRSARVLAPLEATAVLALSMLASFLGVEALAAAVTGGALAPALHGALAFVAFELGTLGALAVASARVRRTGDDGAAPGAPRVSVLVAAWNEATTIGATVRGLLAQSGVELEVVVADDGSTDGTARAVPRDPRVVVLALPHAGKGAALEAARRVARHPVVATVDADTELAPGALRRLVVALDEPDVVAVGGAVLPRHVDSVLTRFQLVEYVVTTWVRAGWSALGMLEQLPGAFSAFRASALEEAGGFPLDSLTEDYEITYRLHLAHARAGRVARTRYVPSARAWTEPPRTLRALGRQRTRWFAGFLSTLWRFRGLMLAPRAGVFGLVRLPLKALDAVLPLVALGSLVLLVRAAAGGTFALTALGAALVALRVVLDALVFAAADRLHVASAGRDREREPARPWTVALALLDSSSYAWLRRLLVLRAYPFALLRVRTWERSRDVAPALAGALGEGALEGAEAPAE